MTQQHLSDPQMPTATVKALQMAGRWPSKQLFRSVSRAQLLACVVVLSALCPVRLRGRRAVLAGVASVHASRSRCRVGLMKPASQSTACWSSNSCISVGEDDESGGEDAIVVPEIDGVPGQAVAVMLPGHRAVRFE